MSQRKDTGLNINPWPKLVDHYKEALEAELAVCRESLWTEAAFLKSAYLKEADRKGIIAKSIAD